MEGPRPEDDEFTALMPEEPEAVESSLDEPLDGPSDDLLLPLLASFSDIFVGIYTLEEWKTISNE